MDPIFDPNNITAIREKSDSITIIFTLLFIFTTWIMILIEEAINN